MTGPASPDIRFHLPPGPQLPPQTWRRRLRWPIRLGSATIAAAMLGLGITALVSGEEKRSTITALGAVSVECATRTAGGEYPVRFGDRVRLYDVDAPGSQPLAVGQLNELRKLGGGVCLAGFTIDDVERVPAFTVQIGDAYRTLVAANALEAGAILR